MGFPLARMGQESVLGVEATHVRPEEGEALYAAALEWAGRVGEHEREVAAGWVRAVVRGTVDGELRMLLVSLAAEESGFAPWVADGRCNEWAWRARYDVRVCDHGAACGLVSLHLDEQRGMREARGWYAPSCAIGLANEDLYVATTIDWVKRTPTAWASMPWHRERIRRQIGKITDLR